MRVMASIEKIVDIKPIEGADKIVKAQVKNWWVVTAIDNGFKVGDLVIYCEIDSWIPHTIAPFLSKGQYPRVYNGVEGERLKTVKLRGQISQGLIMPVAGCFGDTVTVAAQNPMTFREGDDVSQALGIVKYEPPMSAQLAGECKGAFPSRIPKTDEERIQNIKSSDFAELQKMMFEVTEKLEGSSMTVALIDDEFIVCSRNMNLKDVEGNTFWKVAHELEIEKKMRSLVLNNFAIQGELVGEGVQGNHYKLKGHRFYVFSIYDIEKGRYLSPYDRHNLIDQLGLEHVPVLDSCMKSMCVHTHDTLLQMADGQSSINPQVMREGIVFKRVDGQEHFKCVSNKYLCASAN
jgi:RNA ligase (TIGR02306 family)